MYYIMLCYVFVLFGFFLTLCMLVFHKTKVHETARCRSHPLQTLAAGLNISVFRNSVSPTWLQEAL